MRVLYVDVYFLINLTVDVMALFLAVKLLHIKTTLARLLSVSVLGAAAALVDALAGDLIWPTVLSAVLFLALTAIIIGKQLSAVRRTKLLIIFLALEMLIGGIVSYAYQLLDTYAASFGEYLGGGSVNRKALIFSVIILLAIGVLKLFVMVFSGEKSIKSTRISIRVGEASVECDALVDSGNLVRDPMNMNPVVFIKAEVAGRLLPSEVIELEHLDELDCSLRKKIRLIPVTRGGTTHVMTGVLPDEVRLTEEGAQIGVTLAIDKEEGTYGGRGVLVPSCVVEL